MVGLGIFCAIQFWLKTDRKVEKVGILLIMCIFLLLHKLNINVKTLSKPHKDTQRLRGHGEKNENFTCARDNFTWARNNYHLGT